MTEYDTSFVWAVLEGMLVAVLVGLVGALVRSVSTQYAPRRFGGTTRLDRRHCSQSGREGPWPVRPAATANGTQVLCVLIFYLLWEASAVWCLRCLVVCSAGDCGRSLRTAPRRGRLEPALFRKDVPGVEET